MSARLAASLLAMLTLLALSGCATTANNFAPTAVLLDDGSYYFPAQGGNGDYYYEAPQRRNEFSLEFGFGHFPAYSHRYCSPHAWHCPPWAYWPGYGYGHAWPYFGGFGFGGYYGDPRHGHRWRGNHRRQRDDQALQPPRSDQSSPYPNEAAATRRGVDSRRPTPMPRRVPDAPGKPLPRNGGHDRHLLNANDPSASHPDWQHDNGAGATANGAISMPALPTAGHGTRLRQVAPEAAPRRERSGNSEPRPSSANEVPTRVRIRERGHDRRVE